MLIGDGVTPGNEGRGYILRRLLRRAVRSMKLLGVDEADAARAAAGVPRRDEGQLPRAGDRLRPHLQRRLRRGGGLPPHPLRRDDAVRHRRGRRRRRRARRRSRAPRRSRLHDTYGFPIDVTLEMAAEQGVTVDEAGFRALMQEQRDRARADARAKRTGSVDVLAYRRLLAEHGPTDWRAYETLRTDSRVLGVVAERGRRGVAGVAGPGEITRVVLDRTPFYAESGGQVADAGHLAWDGGRAEVLDVQRPVKGLVAHQVRVLEGELRDGHRARRRGRLRVAALGLPGALRHPRRARRAAPGARPAGAAVGLLQPARLPAAGLRLAGRAQPAAARRHRGRRQRRRPRRPRRHRQLDDAARGAGVRRARAVRRDLRRAGPRRRDRRPVVARAVRWHARPRQRADRHAGADRRVVGRLGLAPRRGGRGAGGLPLPGARARPGAPARRAAQDPAGRPGRAGQRHARPPARGRQGARRAARPADRRRGRPARRRGQGRRRRRRWSPARPRAWAAATCAPSPSTSAGRLAGDRPAVVLLAIGVRWQGGTRRRAEPGGADGRTVGQRRAPGGGRRRSVAAVAARPDVAQGGGTDPAGIPAALQAGEQAVATATVGG